MRRQEIASEDPPHASTRQRPVLAAETYLSQPLLRLSQSHRDTAETMKYRTSLLQLAAAALALAACCARATRDTNNGRQAAGLLQYQRPERSFYAGAISGPLSSKRRRYKRSTAVAPWLTVATDLRGGGRGGAAVDVPRGGSTAVATGVKHSAKVSIS